VAVLQEKFVLNWMSLSMAVSSHDPGCCLADDGTAPQVGKADHIVPVIGPARSAWSDIGEKKSAPAPLQVEAAAGWLLLFRRRAGFVDPARNRWTRPLGCTVSERTVKG